MTTVVEEAEAIATATTTVDTEAAVTTTHPASAVTARIATIAVVEATAAAVAAAAEVATTDHHAAHQLMLLAVTAAQTLEHHPLAKPHREATEKTVAAMTRREQAQVQCLRLGTNKQASRSLCGLYGMRGATSQTASEEFFAGFGM